MRHDRRQAVREGAGRLLREAAASGPPSVDELVRLHVAAMVAEGRRYDRARRAAPPARRSGRLQLAALAAAAAVLAASGGLASAGELPGAAQRVVARAVAPLGIALPGAAHTARRDAEGGARAPHPARRGTGHPSNHGETVSRVAHAAPRGATAAGGSHAATGAHGAHPTNHGARVSAIARRRPADHGRRVSEAAHRRHAGHGRRVSAVASSKKHGQGHGRGHANGHPRHGGQRKGHGKKHVKSAARAGGHARRPRVGGGAGKRDGQQLRGKAAAGRATRSGVRPPRRQRAESR